MYSQEWKENRCGENVSKYTSESPRGKYFACWIWTFPGMSKSLKILRASKADILVRVGGGEWFCSLLSCAVRKGVKCIHWAGMRHVHSHISDDRKGSISRKKKGTSGISCKCGKGIYLLQDESSTASVSDWLLLPYTSVCVACLHRVIWICL